jgi:hypothetical protein
MSGTMLTQTFGGPGGVPFKAVSPKSIKLHWGQILDALILNDVQHGGDGGDHKMGLELAADDYWSEFSVNAGKFVDYLQFKSKSGSKVGGGGNGGRAYGSHNVRIVSIGGKAGNGQRGTRLDSITIKWVENYRPSQELLPNSMAIFKAENGQMTIFESEERETTTLEAYQNVTSYMSNSNVSASVEAEYYAKVSGSTSLTIEQSSVTEINKSITDALRRRTEKTITLEADQARFLVGPIRVMKGADGKIWYYPVENVEWVTLNKDGYGRLKGYFDLSGGASTITGFQRTPDNDTKLIKLE